MSKPKNRKHPEQEALQPLHAQLVDAVRAIGCLDLTERDTPEDIEEIAQAVRQLKAAVAVLDERPPTLAVLAAKEVLRLEPFDATVPGMHYRCMHALFELRKAASVIDPGLISDVARRNWPDSKSHWTGAFWSCFHDLSKQDLDSAFVVLPAWAERLYPTHKHLDPYQLALDEFAKGTVPDPGFDYVRGT